MAEADGLDRAWQAYIAALGGPFSLGRWSIASLGVVAACGLALILAPQVVVTDKVQDVWIPLDAVWRLAQGHRLHQEVPTPLGDLYYQVHSLVGGWVGVEEPRLLLWVNALAGASALGLTLLATRDRLPDPLRALSLAALPLCALSPRTLDSVGQIGFNAMYNRWGWVLASVTALVALLPARDAVRGRRGGWSDGLLVALLVLLSFWLKVTFCATVVGLVVLGALVVPASRRALGTGLAAGASVTALSAWTTLGAAYRRDLALAAAANAAGPGLIRAGRLVAVVEANRAWVVAMVVLGVALIRTARSEPERERAGLLALALAASSAGALVVASQNNDATAPLLALVPLLAAAEWRRREDLRLAAFSGVLAAMTLGWPAFLDGRATLAHLVLSQGPTVPVGVAPVDAGGGPLARLRVPDVRQGRPPPMGVGLVLDGTVPGAVYDNLASVPWDVDTPRILADAATLVQRHGLTDRRMASLTFSQFLPLLFQSPSPRGIASWYDYQRTFHESFPACASLADTEVVLVPEVWVIPQLREVHQPCLDADFVKVDATRLWTLYVRL